jgi:hypothetical protein
VITLLILASIFSFLTGYLFRQAITPAINRQKVKYARLSGIREGESRSYRIIQLMDIRIQILEAQIRKMENAA